MLRAGLLSRQGYFLESDVAHPSGSKCTRTDPSVSESGSRQSTGASDQAADILIVSGVYESLAVAATRTLAPAKQSYSPP